MRRPPPVNFRWLSWFTLELEGYFRRVHGFELNRDQLLAQLGAAAEREN
jgi:hypothetical protein